MAELPANQPRFLFSVDDFDAEPLRVVRFRAREGISAPFQVDLDLAAEDPELPLEDLLGRDALLTVLGPGEPRYFHGLVREIEQGASGSRFTGYRATLVPQVWRLTQRFDCRIFQHLTLEAIIGQVLAEAGVPEDTYVFSLQEPHPSHEYCVQYRESDFDFVCRLMEEEGVFYFFEHHPDRHILVMTDNPAAHAAIPGEEAVPFHPRTGLAAGLEDIHSFRFAHAIRSGGARLRDYSFRKPSLTLERDQGADRDADLERYDYPGGYLDPDRGGKVAGLRLEEQQTRRRTGRGEGLCARLTPGFLFSLTGHPRSDLDRRYLVTAVSHEGEQPQSLEEEAPDQGHRYGNRFECIPDDVTFRAPRTTRRPVVEGPQTAIVVGPQGEEIYTDEHGRVKVQFHWDRRGGYDQDASCWLRVSQLLAGDGWGAMHLPRVGQEVIVDFLEGNPDCPLVTGRVYHGTNRPPYPLPDHKTISTLKSNSSKGGEGFNELRFEDRKGEEQVFIHAERNQDVRVKHCLYTWVGHEAHEIVVENRLTHVQNDRHARVDHDHREAIGNDRHLDVTGKQALRTGGSHSLTVSGDMIEVFEANHVEQTGGELGVSATGVVIEASSGVTLKCGSSAVVIDASGITLTGSLITLDGQMVNIASGPGSPAMSGPSARAVAPAEPEQAQEADDANPGRVERVKRQQRQEGSGKYGGTAERGFKPAQGAAGSSGEDGEEATWIEIELHDEEGEPVPGEPYKLILPDGSVKKGTLDENGFARVEGVKPGTARVVFPRLDETEWDKG